MLRFLILCLASGAAFSANCPNGWMRYESSCYLFGQTAVTWGDALTFCKALSSTLVEIESQAEDNFIQTSLIHRHQHDTAKPHGYWIGLTDVVIQHEWFWIKSGTHLSSGGYSHWEPKQPDSRESENCGILWSATSFTWHDDFCSDNLAFFICEMLAENGEEVIG